MGYDRGELVIAARERVSGRMNTKIEISVVGSRLRHLHALAAAYLVSCRPFCGRKAGGWMRSLRVSSCALPKSSLAVLLISEWGHTETHRTPKFQVDTVST